jgi:hypothetical protein
MSFVSQWAYEFEHAIVTELAIRSIPGKINTSTGQPISTSKFILICASHYFDLTPFPDNHFINSGHARQVDSGFSRCDGWTGINKIKDQDE